MVSTPHSSSSVSPRAVGFLLLDNFTLISLASAVEALRMANQLSGEHLFSWYTLSADGQAVSASDGIMITPDASIRDELMLDTVIVVGGVNVADACHKVHLEWLKRMDRKGCNLGGICTGAHALAAAGLLDGYECSVHWEYLASMRECFPRVTVTNRLYTLDRKRFTASGGTVPLDMMMRLIELQHGKRLSVAISDMFICDRIRDSNDQQRVPLQQLLGNAQPKLLDVVALMEANIEEPLELNQLAAYVGLSRRQLERLFIKHLHSTPSRYYLKIRLLRAKQLLLQNSMPIIEVAQVCGFVSTPHFSKCYRAQMGIAPSKERANQKQRTAAPDGDPVVPSTKPAPAGREVSISTSALDKAKKESTFGSVNLKDKR